MSEAVKAISKIMKTVLEMLIIFSFGGFCSLVIYTFFLGIVKFAEILTQ